MNFSDQIITVFSWHPNIANQYVWPVIMQSFQRFRGGGRSEYLSTTLIGENPTHNYSCVGIVIDD